MRMVSSSGKSSRRRRAICSGLHAVAQRRSCRRPRRRPFHGTTGPRTAAPFGAMMRPASRSCTYRRSGSLIASLADFGRRAERSACHCAVVARYARPPLRVAALRRSSREIVDGARSSRRAISRSPYRCARQIAISSRSANDRERSPSGFAAGARWDGGMPPALRNQRAPTAGDTPASTAASSLERPAAMAAQNWRGCSRRATEGRPGEGNAPRPDRSERRFRTVIATSPLKVLRRPLEPGLFTADALHCQKDGFAQAAATSNALLVRIKENQPILHATLAGLCAEQRPFDSYETVDRGRHGRQEHRRVEVFDTTGQLDAPWQTLIACVARVSRLTYTKNTRSGLWPTREEVGYYPCQTRYDAKFLARAIRAHWGIESAPQAQERKVRDELTDRAQAA